MRMRRPLLHLAFTDRDDIEEDVDQKGYHDLFPLGQEPYIIVRDSVTGKLFDSLYDGDLIFQSDMFEVAHDGSFSLIEPMLEFAKDRTIRYFVFERAGEEPPHSKNKAVSTAIVTVTKTVSMVMEEGGGVRQSILSLWQCYASAYK